MKCELLAPAGNFECLKQAVFGGANAVYFGGKNFNARAKAENFGEDLKTAVAFCHMYGVKAYLTLNTIVENDDFNQLIETAKNALKCGIDAFIVQDFGVLHVLKNNFTNIEIHTSTQMAVNNYLGAIEAEKMGAKRVVLSRETSIQDIKLIKEKTNLEIEYFIQGALCVCFSGNCYLSSKLFGKSGNKGECLQPCRLPYSAFKNGKIIKSGYLLSAKDICMANRLKELVDAGVDSFKIEGRLRRKAYVSAVVKTYRKIIDSNYNASVEEINNLKKAFNRGDYTEGYFNGNSDIIDDKIQGHKGIEIGKVIDFKKGNKFNIVKIKSTHNISKGDVLKFIKDGKENQIITAVDVSFTNGIYSITTTSSILLGSSVNLILDSAWEQNLISTDKKLSVDFNLIALKNKPISLTYSFNQVSGTILGEVCVAAEKQPLCQEVAKAQLSKLNDTYFVLNNFSFVSDGVFVSKKELNQLRRKAIEEIINKYEKNIEIKTNKIAEKNIINNNKIINYKSLEISDKNTSDADLFVVKPKDYNSFNYNEIKHNNCYLYIPAFLRKADIELIDKVLTQNPNLGVYAENIGALGYNKKTILGAKLNIKNIYAIKQLINANITAIVASPEIGEENYNKLKALCPYPIFKASFENFDLMTLVHCPIKMLYNSNCKNCKFSDDIIYKMDNGKELILDRYKLANCYFTLKEKSLNKNVVYYNN